MRAAVLITLACLAPAVTAASPCAKCSQGDALVAHYHLEPLRAISQQLQSMKLDETLTTAQYAQLVDLRRRTPALVAVGALADDDLGAVAASLCGTPTGACVDATTQALRCAADRCAVDLPAPDKNADVIEISTACRTYAARQGSPWFGVGFDWGNGVQRSRFLNDGGAWSFGIQGRARLGNRFGAVARLDRIAGRDRAEDANDDGSDDMSTGSITRLAALAGPSIVLDNARWDSTTRSLRLDLLGGWLSTRSQPGETGPVAGADLAFQLTIVRFGVRVLQGFSDASSASILLAHFDLISGSAPVRDDSTDCASTPSRRTRLALGLDFPLGGAGLAHLGYLGTGLAIEPIWHLTRSFDAVTRLDLLVFPGDERDRVIHEAALAGLRMDHAPDRSRSTKVGFYTTLLGGYTHSAGLTPTAAGSGPIVDLSLGWGGQDAEGAAGVRLHARFGVGPDNFDYRAIFFSGGFELRFDSQAWGDRF